MLFYLHLLLILFYMAVLVFLLALLRKDPVIRHAGQALTQFIHFLPSELRLWIFDAVEPILQDLYVLFLISDKTAIGGVPDSDLKVQRSILIKITVVDFWNGDELVIAPALADIEFG